MEEIGLSLKFNVIKSPQYANFSKPLQKLLLITVFLKTFDTLFTDKSRMGFVECFYLTMHY